MSSAQRPGKGADSGGGYVAMLVFVVGEMSWCDSSPPVIVGYNQRKPRG